MCSLSPSPQASVAPTVLLVTAKILRLPSATLLSNSSRSLLHFSDASANFACFILSSHCCSVSLRSASVNEGGFDGST
jgi:hypothetical protein